jgi:hypothetical protein
MDADRRMVVRAARCACRAQAAHGRRHAPFLYNAAFQPAFELK